MPNRKSKRPPAADLPPLPIRFGQGVNRVTILLQRTMQRRMAEAGFEVQIEEWAVMLVLLQAGSLRHGELAERTFRDRTTLTRFLDGLEKKGYVKRERAPDDRRSILLSLTQESMDLMQKLLPLAFLTLSTALDGLSERDQQRLTELLEKVEGNLSRAYSGNA